MTPERRRSRLHRSTPPLAVLLLALVVLPGCQFEDHPSEDASPEPALGTVQFPTSCSAAAQPHLERGLLMLHHMMYPQAEEAFREAAEIEEGCSMAHWGLAMAHFQPFWGSANVEMGRVHAERARTVDPPTEREALYVRAAFAFHEDPAASYAERLSRWEGAMEELHVRFPDDPEAATLFALAHLSVAPADPDRQSRAGEIVEAVHARIPDHPGAVHYAIHVHDVDALAEAGVPFAEAYEDLAPSIPHALHMPSHIYVRTGDWDQVIFWNRESADAALQHPAGEYVSLHYPHALDYLIYGHLQLAQDDEARAILEEIRTHAGYEPHLASAYALAAVPARWHVERRDWEGAAALQPRVPADFVWDEFPAAEAMTWFARGLGAARTGDAEGTRDALGQLDALGERTADLGDTYWTHHIQVQRRGLAAWLALVEGRPNDAVAEMTAAAALEETMEKHAITPGELQPAWELLGDLLLEVGEPAGALEAYEASLENWPRRYHTLLGAARAAEEVGEAEVAAAYWDELAELAEEANADREGIGEIRERAARQE